MTDRVKWYSLLNSSPLCWLLDVIFLTKNSRLKSASRLRATLYMIPHSTNTPEEVNDDTAENKRKCKNLLRLK